MVSGRLYGPFGIRCAYIRVYVHTIRQASYDEFISWYLRREFSKRGMPIPELGSVSQQRETMSRDQKGKLQPWFLSGKWSLVELESENDLLPLVCLASDWTRNSGLLANEDLSDSRVLKRFVDQAIDVNYFAEAGRPTSRAENMEKRGFYLSQILSNPAMRFVGDDCIVLRSLCADEKRRNPSGTFYLHDGLGRMMSYAYAISRGVVAFSPVEAFMARPDSSDH
jgi:hypothetical protein